MRQDVSANKSELRFSHTTSSEISEDVDCSLWKLPFKNNSVEMASSDGQGKFLSIDDILSKDQNQKSLFSNISVFSHGRSASPVIGAHVYLGPCSTIQHEDITANQDALQNVNGSQSVHGVPSNQDDLMIRDRGLVYQRTVLSLPDFTHSTFACPSIYQRPYYLDFTG